MPSLNDSREAYFEMGDTEADLYYLAGWLVVGEQFRNAPRVSVIRDSNNRPSFLEIEHNRLSNAQDNRQIHENPNTKKMKTAWERATYDMVTILSGPIAERIFRESRGEKMKERDDIIELIVRSICEIQDICRASELLVSDIETAIALTKPLVSDPEYGKLLGDDLEYLPNILAWMPWLLQIAAELYPPEYGCIFGCRVQVEKSYASVNNNWARIVSKALELSGELLGISEEN